MTSSLVGEDTIQGADDNFAAVTGAWTSSASEGIPGRIPSRDDAQLPKIGTGMTVSFEEDCRSVPSQGKSLSVPPLPPSQPVSMLDLGAGDASSPSTKSWAEISQSVVELRQDVRRLLASMGSCLDGIRELKTRPDQPHQQDVAALQAMIKEAVSQSSSEAFRRHSQRNSFHFNTDGGGPPPASPRGPRMQRTLTRVLDSAGAKAVAAAAMAAQTARRESVQKAATTNFASQDSDHHRRRSSLDSRRSSVGSSPPAVAQPEQQQLNGIWAKAASKHGSVDETHASCVNHVNFQSNASFDSVCTATHPRGISPASETSNLSKAEISSLRKSRYSRFSQWAGTVGRKNSVFFGPSALQDVWKLLEDAESSSQAAMYARFMGMFSMFAAFFTLMLDSLPFMVGPAVMGIEVGFDCVFLVDLLLRFAASPSRWYFFSGPFNVIDFLGVVPPLVVRALIGFEMPDVDVSESAPRFVVLCYVPIFRLLKTLRFFKKFHLLMTSFSLAFEALPVLLYVMTIIIMVFSSLIYLVEPRTNIPSLPKAMWLTIVTMTTVGYGDVTPESDYGFLVVAVLNLGSVLYMAVPLALVGHAFTEVWGIREEVLLMQKVRNHFLLSGYTAHDIPHLFRRYNDQGWLVMEDFRTMLTEMRFGLKEEELIDLFNIFDKDISGTISDLEFVRTLFPKQFAEVSSAWIIQHASMGSSEDSEKLAAKREPLGEGTGPGKTVMFSDVQ